MAGMLAHTADTVNTIDTRRTTIYNWGMAMTERHKTVRMTMEFDREQMRLVDRWRVEQDPVPSRAEAIRRLLQKAVEALEAERR